MKIRHSESYVPLRSAAYPQIGEQLDAIYKLAASLQAQGIELPEETLQWIDKCREVKARYPKN